MQDRIYSRSIVNLKDFPLKIEFTSENGSILVGKVYDISPYGLCALVSDINIELSKNMKGQLKIWKVEEYEILPAEIKWINNSFVGFEVETNLIKTKLKKFIE